MQTADDILNFWFEEAGPTSWFKQSDAFDQLCRERFLTTLEAARRGECWPWRQTPAGRCAEIIVLDQFSRNLYRNDARAFAGDGIVLILAQEVVNSGDDLRMTPDQRYFSYMPYMHSESLLVHDEARRLFEDLGNANALRYEIAHREVIKQFGRYPGRNAALGRENSEAEGRYLRDNKTF
ncbi:MAG: hypothetical protein ACI87W_001935 [Halieaceae bacterium]|jgi:uncharacterized protein (DUF924 family)